MAEDGIYEGVWKDTWVGGETAFYEYHCNCSHDSADAELWYRSHQQVEVIEIAQPGGGDTMSERCDGADPRTYRVKFPDGHVGEAFEDELMLNNSRASPQFAPPSQAEIDKHRKTAS